VRFADVLDQHHAVGLLRAAIRGGAVHHAYLFAGPSGTGRSGTARAFAQALQCRRFDGDACGRCEDCVKAQNGVHPDIRWIEPLERKDRPGELKDSIGIEQIREARVEAGYGPYEGKFKVFLLNPADKLTEDAQNSLLKTLEEPPPKVVFVLVSESTQVLRPTIVSRCQLLRFSLVPHSQIARILEAQLGVEAPRARVLAALSGGRIAHAAASARSDNALADRDAVVGWLLRVEADGILAMLEAAEQLARPRDRESARRRLSEHLDLALLWYRDALVWQETREDHLLVNVDRRADIEKVAASVGAAGLRRRIAAIEEAHEAVRRNVTPRLALEAMFLRFLDSEAAGARP
jgi:DNA polymerase-3 subunit delta'